MKPFFVFETKKCILFIFTGTVKIQDNWVDFSVIKYIYFKSYNTFFAFNYIITELSVRIIPLCIKY